MFRFRSTPELGNCRNPLEDFRCIAVCKTVMSAEELEAESIYYAAVSAGLCKCAFMILANDLTRRSEVAGAYLTWLIYRGHQWPGVATPKEGKDARLP